MSNRTRQEIFDIVYRHLLSQNKRSMAGTVCAYRGIDGTKCAIGALIADEQYRPAFEGVALSTNPQAYYDDGSNGEHYTRRAIIDAARIGYNDLAFAQCLQRIHDSRPEIEWHDALLDFAEMYQLSIPKRVTVENHV